ncbi:TolC family protein, partial [Paraburkholderia sp. BR10954]|uniref:TolC family protein n=1 Tax=Paraburkholderia sp. BR10954 TaxID=3236995 RepID=UPI0034D18220
MKTQTSRANTVARSLKLGVSVISFAVLAACANYAGIHSDKQINQPQQLETARSLPQEHGNWPSPDWVDQFGDAQLKALIAEALQGSPTLAQARARVEQAQAYSETAKANTLPRVDASYSLTRQQFSSSALIPPPYAGSWQTENKGLLSASYDLDLWGKNREALRAAVSEASAAEADEQVVRLTLDTSIARTYNELARLYALRDIAQQEVARREQIDRITSGRIANGLDTEVERKTADANLSTSRARVSALDGSILSTRYQLAALLGKGPDRGLAITR